MLSGGYFLLETRQNRDNLESTALRSVFLLRGSRNNGIYLYYFFFARFIF